MTKEEALKLALEALERSVATCFNQYAHQQVMSQPDHFINTAITAIKEALANVATEDTSKERVDEMQKQRHEQEPVAWPCLIAEADFSENTVILAMQCTDYKVSAGNHWLSNTPPQRTWVGLTDEDKKQMAKEANYHWEMTAGEYAERIGQLTEAKLKEKNNA